MDNFLYILSNVFGFIVGFSAFIILLLMSMILIIKIKDLTGR